MNLINIRFYMTIVALIGFVFAKIIYPEQLESKEILEIYNKEREYFRLIEDKLTYFVEGPCVFSVYSRVAFPKMSNDMNAYKFNVSIDDIDSFIVKHDHRKDLNVESDMHPGHAYTISGKDIINIPKGQHRIELVSVNDNSNLLIRCVSNPFKKHTKLSSEITAKNSNYINYEILQTGEKNLKYYSLSKKNLNNIFFDIEGPNTIKIISRISFDDNDKDGYYHFKIRQDNKLISNHHMFSSLSKGTKILNNKKLKVGKYRTSHLSIPDGQHQYELELIFPSDQEVYFRFEK